MNIVITGHIDHGKSTLIGRLLFDTKSVPDSMIDEVLAASGEGKPMEFAYFLDCLEEERAQNITIDTTQTFFKTTKRRYTIIDAPGHKEFLRNMVSGASLAEAAILMIDAERGIEEQTRRHVAILQLLGVKQIIVAINKMDAVGYDERRFLALRDEIVEFFGRLGAQPTTVIPVAAKLGENIAQSSQNLGWYQGATLLETLDALERVDRTESGAPRITVQGTYELDGATLVLGRVESGVVEPGMELSLLPDRTTAKVRVIRAMEGTQPKAAPGACVALELDGAMPRRGSTLVAGKAPQMTQELTTVIFALTDTPIETAAPLVLQCGTQSVPCEVKSIKDRINSSTLEKLPVSNSLEPTQVGTVEITLKEPLVFEKFTEVPALGRFVLVRDGEIQGAGIIN